MNSFFRYMIKSVGFLGLWIVFFPQIGATYEPIPAELTANTNLRESPDINGNIIVVLKKRDRILVRDEKPQWANIVYEKNGHKYNGWISAKYLMKTATAPQEQKAKDFEDNPVSQTPQSFSDTAVAPAPPERIAETTEKQRTIASVQPAPSGKTVADTATSPLSGDDLSIFFKNKGGIRIKAEAFNLESEQASTYGLFGIITRFLFKISLVIMSSVALILSFSALQIAKSNRLHYPGDGERITRIIPGT